MFNNLVILCSLERHAAVLRFRDAWITHGDMFGEMVSNDVWLCTKDTYQTPSGSIRVPKQEVFTKLARNSRSWPIVPQSAFSFY